MQLGDVDDLVLGKASPTDLTRVLAVAVLEEKISAMVDAESMEPAAFTMLPAVPGVTVKGIAPIDVRQLGAYAGSVIGDCPATAQCSNGYSGNNASPGTLAVNVTQQQYFADSVTKAILPGFVQSGKPL